MVKLIYNDKKDYKNPLNNFKINDFLHSRHSDMKDDIPKQNKSNHHFEIGSLANNKIFNNSNNNNNSLNANIIKNNIENNFTNKINLNKNIINISSNSPFQNFKNSIINKKNNNK